MTGGRSDERQDKMSEALPAATSAVLDAFRGHLSGALLVPSDPGYPPARRIWNGAIDRRPAAILICADAEDVSLAVRIATDHGLPLTVRGGGHNVAGRSVRDGKVLLDLSRLRTVSVNGDLGVATAQGGALWLDVDAATGAAGLATTGGLVSSTGVGGFTLGGGTGWLMRKHGLACDNLRSAGVVLADGRFVRASQEEHPDLWWALRGGSGGFGVVTSFELQLYPQREVLAGLVIHPVDHAFEALQNFRDFAADAPDDFCGIAVIARAPPLPFLDASWHGRPVLIFALCWAGSLTAGEDTLAPLRGFGRPLAEHVGAMPYAQWQQMLDPAAPAGRHYYWKTANYESLSDEVLRQLAAAANFWPQSASEIHLQHMGGAVARGRPQDSAFAHRAARFFINVIGAAEHAEQYDAVREWARALYAKVSHDALAGVLPNFADQEQLDEMQWFGSQRAARLQSLRRQYDPTGTFSA